MTPFELARALKQNMILADSAIPDGPEVREDLSDAFVTVDPENVPEFPSTSRNNVHFFGCEREVSEADVDRVLTFYKEAGVERFFFWLSPCPQLDQIKGWLSDRGLKAWEGTGYPTLLRKAEKLPEHQTELTVKRVGPDEAAGYASDIKKIYADPRFRPVFVETCGAPGQHHFLGFDGERAVSAGILHVTDSLGSLGWMATAEDARGKGGQSALIVARVNLAVELGCEWVSGSTLYALESSLNNMRRKGFEVLYDREVYG